MRERAPGPSLSLQTSHHEVPSTSEAQCTSPQAAGHRPPSDLRVIARVPLNISLESSATCILNAR